MKLQMFALLFAFASCQRLTKIEEVTLKISKGFKEKIGKMPFQTQLVNANKSLFCGATIIDKCWVITAAHCLLNRRDKVWSFNVISGSSIAGKGKVSEVKQIIPHPGFDESTYVNDIGLIELKKCIEYNKNQSAVALSNKEPQANDLVKISGYGKTGTHRKFISVFLRAGLVPVIDKNVCRRRYARLHRVVDDSVFCAGDGTTDSCDGDSGGPAVLDDHLVGIISEGEDCSDDYYPSKYTRVDFHLDWIRNVTGIDFGRD